MAIFFLFTLYISVEAFVFKSTVSEGLVRLFISPHFELC